MTQDQQPTQAETEREALLDALEQTFKDAWHGADDRGEEGARTRQGLMAVLDHLVKLAGPHEGDEVLPLSSALDEVAKEAVRSIELHGLQAELPLGTGPGVLVLAHDLTTSVDLIDADSLAKQARRRTQERTAVGMQSWADILLEETLECVAEEDPHRVREEAVQVAAVASKIVALLSATLPEVHTHLVDGKTGWTVCCKRPSRTLPSQDVKATREQVLSGAKTVDCEDQR